MRTRVAPTPSGYLHLGNALNFAIIAEFAGAQDAELMLRIDDMDAARIRPEYLADIHRVLDWLEIRPAGVIPTDRIEAYRDALANLDTYNCRCSRTAAEDACACSGRGYPLVPFESAAKLLIEGKPVVMWRRDDVPAYHLVNVVADGEAGITHVIRGEDLRESSAIHGVIAERLGVAAPVYLHHELLLADGQKLSKSTLRSGGPMVCDTQRLAWVRARAKDSALS